MMWRVGGVALLAGIVGCGPRGVVESESSAPVVSSEVGQEEGQGRFVRARLGTADFRVDDALQAVAFTPDGERLVAAGQSGGIVLLDRGTGRHLRRIAVEDSDVWDMVLLPDGKSVAVAVQGGVRRYSVETGQPLSPLLVEEDAVEALALDETGRYLAVVGGSGALRVVEIASGEVVSSFGGSKEYREARFVPGTAWLAASRSDRVGLWNWKEGRREHQLPTSQIGTFGVASDGSWIAVVGYGQSWELRLWSLRDGRRLQVIPVENTGAIASSADGKTVLMNERTVIAGWDAQTGARTVELAPTSSYVRTIAISPDGADIAAGGNDHTVGLWRFEDGRHLTPSVGHRGEVRDLSFSLDGRHLVSTSLGDDQVIVWSVDSGEPTASWFSEGGLAGASFDYSGKRLVLASHGEMGREHFRSVGVAGGQERTWIMEAGLVRGVRVQPQGDLAVVEGGRLSLIAKDGRAVLWSSDPISPREEPGDADAQFSLDGTQAVLFADRQWLSIDISGRASAVRGRVQCGLIQEAAIAGGGRFVVASVTDILEDRFTVALWDRGQPAQEIDVDGGAIDVAIDASGDLIAYATDGAVGLWKPSAGRRWSISRIRPRRVAFDPRGELLAVGLGNGTVEIWDRSHLVKALPSTPAALPPPPSDPCEDAGQGGFGMIGVLGSGDQVDLYEGMFRPPPATE